MMNVKNGIRILDELHAGIQLPKDLSGNLNIIKATKYFQSPVFFEKEFELWRNNGLYKGDSLHISLYLNRMRYINKKPYELTDFEILRAFKIMGIHRGFSSFDIKLMGKVIEDFNVKSVFDPCAGWGERLLYSYKNNVQYLGVDINSKLFKGYSEMINHFDIKDCKMINADSSLVDINGNYDLVFTCPPYYNIEIYSNIGAENLSYPDFLIWWDNVVKNSLHVNPKLFAFQINNKYAKDMSNIVIKNGFEFLVEYKYDDSKNSHFNYKDGKKTKTEAESVLVFRKV